MDDGLSHGLAHACVAPVCKSKQNKKKKQHRRREQSGDLGHVVTGGVFGLQGQTKNKLEMRSQEEKTKKTVVAQVSNVAPLLDARAVGEIELVQRLRCEPKS